MSDHTFCSSLPLSILRRRAFRVNFVRIIRCSFVQMLFAYNVLLSLIFLDLACICRILVLDILGLYLQNHSSMLQIVEWILPRKSGKMQCWLLVCCLFRKIYTELFIWNRPSPYFTFYFSTKTLHAKCKIPSSSSSFLIPSFPHSSCFCLALFWAFTFNVVASFGFCPF